MKLLARYQLFLQKLAWFLLTFPLCTQPLYCLDLGQKPGQNQGQNLPQQGQATQQATSKVPPETDHLQREESGKYGPGGTEETYFDSHGREQTEQDYRPHGYGPDSAFDLGL
jgi:hypothetical protein